MRRASLRPGVSIPCFLAAWLLFPFLLEAGKAPEVITDRIFYPSHDLQVAADLVRPAEGRHPLILLNHGEITRRREDLFPQAGKSYIVRKGEEIAEQGYAVLICHYRGFGASEGERAGLWEELDDLEAGLEMMKNQSWVDPDKIAVIGGDVGGTLTYMLCQKRTDIKAGVVFDAPVDFLDPEGAFRKNSLLTVEIREDLARRLGGTIGLKPELYRPISPYYNMNDMHAPVLIVHAEEDVYIPLKQAMLAQQALLESHKPFQFLHVTKGNQFILMTPASRGPAKLAWNEVYRFLEKYLK